MEEWRPVVGLEGYEVSCLGRVRSWRGIGCKPQRPLEPRLLNPTRAKRGGYLVVHPARDGKYTPVLVHHLVLEAFVGPRPVGMEGCHGDDDRHNNRLENLRWDTRSENVKDAYRNGRR